MSSSLTRDSQALGFPVRVLGFVSVFVLPLTFNPWAGDAFNRPKFEVLCALAAMMALAWLVSCRVAKWPRWQITRPELPMWLFLFAALLSTWRSTNAGLSVLGGSGRYEGLLTVGACLVLYCVGVHFFASGDWLRRLGGVVSTAGVVTAVYGLSQLFLPPAFFAESLMREWYGGLGYLRPLSTFGSPVVFGGFLSFVIPIAVSLALTSGGGGRYVWSAAVALMCAALVLTSTRAAWLAGVLAGAEFAAAVGRQISRHWRVLLATLLVTGAVLLALGVGAPSRMSPQLLGSRAASSFDIGAGSAGQRVYIWKQVVALIRARPLLGWGLETLREVFPYDRSTLVRVFGARPVIVDRAHNDLLHTAVSIGVPGAVAYASFWLVSIVVAVRLVLATHNGDQVIAAGWLAALSAYLIQAQFSFSAIALTPLLWLFAGAAAGWNATLNGVRHSHTELIAGSDVP